MIFVTLYACLFWTLFNFTAPLMGGVYIIGELGGSTDIAFYTLSFFGLGNACIFPVSRSIENRLGKIQGLFVFVLLFALTTLCLAFATTFPMFVVLRFIEGLFSGVFFSFSLNLINLLQKESQKKRFFAYSAFIVAVTPVLGACFGGWIAYDFHWRFIFLLQIPFIAATLYFLYKYRSILEEPIVKDSFDSIGCIFYLLSIAPLITAICLGQELDWLRSPLICTLFIISLISFPFFILRELKKDNPLIDLRLFKIPAFSLAAFSAFILFSTYFGTVVLLSLWLHLDVDYTPLWIALLLLHMIFAAFLLYIFVLRWMEKTHPFLPVLLSTLCFAISSFYSAYFNAEINFGRIAMARVLAGFGLAFFFFPLIKIALDSVPLEKKAQGMSIIQSFRVLSSSFGIAFYSTLWIRRKVFYNDRLGSSLTETSELTNSFLAQLSLFGQKGLAAKELLNEGLSKQATALGLGDCFYFMGWLITGLFIAIFLFSFKSLISYYKERLLVQKRKKQGTT